jgi:hypothetical protein
MNSGEAPQFVILEANRVQKLPWPLFAEQRSDIPDPPQAEW